MKSIGPQRKRCIVASFRSPPAFGQPGSDWIRGVDLWGDWAEGEPRSGRGVYQCGEWAGAEAWADERDPRSLDGVDGGLK